MTFVEACQSHERPTALAAQKQLLPRSLLLLKTESIASALGGIAVMAPSTSNAMVDQAPQVKATGSVGAYRGLEIVGYDKEAEEHGKNGVAPAKVRS